MSAKKLKLFVWENIFHDYTAGMACALANDSEEARQLIAKKMGYGPHGDLAAQPRIIEQAEGFYVYGAG